MARIHRPVVAANLVLPLLLQANELKTCYVRVASQTPIDLTLTLWTPEGYVAEHHDMEIFHVMVMGTLLALILFSLLVYLKWHDRVYLFFCATLFFESLIDNGFTGLLQIYFWPKELPFDIRFLILAAGGLMISFVLFSQQIIGERQRYLRYYRAIYATLGVLLLAILWACLVHTGQAIPVVYMAVLAVVTSCIALIFKAWR